MIEIHQLEKRFGDFRAVAGVSFAAADGSITGLLGPNGAGKTTLLRMLCGLLRPDGGSARVDGGDVAAQPLAARRRLGVLTEADGVYPRLTVRENVRYFGALHGLTGAALEGAVARSLQQLGLSAMAERRCAGLSRGEALKVSLARALVHGPRNLILDEPTSGLDVNATRALRQLLRQLRDEGRAILFSSHILGEVSVLCDRVVVLARGQVVASGSPAKLRQATGREQLEDAFVDLIGSGEGLS